MRSVAQLALAAALVGCTPASKLAVDLRTDMVPGVDYVATRLSVEELSEPPIERLAFGADVEAGYRIAEVFGLGEGTYALRLEMLDRTGEVVLSQRSLVNASRFSAVTLLATRSCRGVFCPGEETCVDGGCASSGCLVEDPMSCAPACMADADCGEDAGRCAGYACVEGQCLVSLAESCEADEWCHVEQGCVPRETRTPPSITLLVEGEGSVSYGDGERCGSGETCTITGDRGATVTLTATEEGEVFWGWSGGTCDDPLSPCVETLDGQRTIRAVFAPTFGEVESLADVRVSGLLGMPDGSFLVADVEAVQILHVTRDGTVDPFAGSGRAGYADGPVADAMFSGPSGLARDAAGNVYVADTGNNRIRRITPAGMVETYAGTGVNGTTDGPRLEADIGGPVDVAFREADGALLVATRGGLRVVGPTDVTTIDVAFGQQGAVDVDPEGVAVLSSTDAILRLPPGSDTPEEITSAPCGFTGARRNQRIAVSPITGEIVEAADGGTFCRVDTSGRHTRVILDGLHMDGPDYLARNFFRATPVEFAPDGALAFSSDPYPGRTLRLLVPR